MMIRGKDGLERDFRRSVVGITCEGIDLAKLRPCRHCAPAGYDVASYGCGRCFEENGLVVILPKFENWG